MQLPLDRTRFMALAASISACACAAPNPPVARPLGESAERTADGPKGLDAEAFDRLEEQLLLSRGPCVRPQRPASRGLRRSKEAPPLLTGPARRCRQLRELPGPACEDSGLLFNDCLAAVSPLEEEVARDTMRCLESKNGTHALCRDRRPVARCVQRAMSLSLVSLAPATAELCQFIELRCQRDPDAPRGGLTAIDCQRYLTSLRCWHVAEMSNCIYAACSVSECVQPSF